MLATSPVHADVSVGGDGLLATSVPIDVPPFHQITPAISLSYSSSAGYGLAGAGWSLRVGGQIVRVSATGGIANNTASDHLVLDGLELVPCAAGSTSPSCTTAVTAFGSSAGFFTTRLESFRRIQQASANEFVVWDRDGITSRYTSVDNGISFQLRAVDDLRGHRVTYEWTCNQGCELDTIRYGGRNGAPGTEVRLYRESRPDPRAERVANGVWVHGERLRSIVIKNHGSLLRAYEFLYGDSLETRASILTGVRQFGSDALVSATGAITAGATPPLPTRTFSSPSLGGAGTFELSAETSSPGLFDTSSPPLNALAPRYPSGFTAQADVETTPNGSDYITSSSNVIVGDFDGDGREEVTAWALQESCEKIAFCTYRTSNTGGAPSMISSRRDAGTTATCVDGRNEHARTFRIDADGDGIDDILLANGTELRLYEGRSTGDFAAGVVTAWDPATGGCTPADVDGNGRQDLVCELPATRQIVVRRARPNGWLTTTLSTTSGPLIPDHQNLELVAGDVDGDGLDDIVLARGASGATSVVFGRSRGDGTFDWPDAQTFAFIGKLGVGDVDGDAQLDLMWSRQVGSVFELDVAVARKGNVNSRWLSVPRQTTTLRTPLLADVDGDGRSDLVGLTWSFELRVQRATGDGMFGTLEAALATCPDSGSSGHPAELVPADFNGDGTADPTCITDHDEGAFEIAERPGQPRGADRRRWQRADLDGDGRPELVYVAFKNPGYVVHVVSPSTNQHRTFVVDQTAFDRLREPDAGRWLVTDIGSAAGPADGKDDLVLVELIAGRIVTTALLSTGLATFQVVQQDVAPAVGGVRSWVPAAADRSGRSSLMRLSAPPNGGARIEWLRPTSAGNFAHGFAQKFGTGSPAPITDRAASRFRPADVDADGLTDFVLVDNVPDSPTAIVRTLRADGSGGYVEIASTIATSWIGPRAVRIADLDGDGAADLYHVARSASASSPCLAITQFAGDGHGGFSTGTYGGMPCLTSPDPLYRRLFESAAGIVALDLDRDGRPELVHATHARDANGSQQLVVTRVRRDATGWRVTTFQPKLPFDLGDAWMWTPYQDPSGDVGLAYLHPQLSQVLRWRRVRDEMTQTANGLGRVETISYGPLFGGRGYLPTGYTPRVVYAVTVVDQASAVPTVESMSYGYGGATWSNEQGRLLGFTATYANDGRAVRLARYALGESCGAQLVASETQDLGGAMWGSTSFTYGSPGVDRFPCLVKVTTDYECERTTTCRTAKIRELAYDNYGNTLSEYDIADGARSKITQTTYVIAAAPFIVEKPSGTIEYGYDGAAWRILSATRPSYDNQAIGVAPIRGERTALAVFDDQTLQAPTTRYGYDVDGNLVWSTSPNNVLQTFDYDPTYRRYLTATCTALHCEIADPDLVLGVATTVHAANGGVSSTRYDAHGRLKRAQDARLGVTTIQYLDIGVVGAQRIRIEQTDGSAGDGVLWTERYFDGNNRTYRVTREGGATTTALFADNSDRPSAVSNVYATGTSPTLFTEYRYDGIGRRIETRHPDGNTLGTTYVVGARIERDEKSATHRYELDGNAAVVRVVDPLHLTTQYKRDALGRIIEIVDASANLERRAYSTRGLVTSTTDPDRGLVENTYTPDGALETRRDAKHQRMVFGYDPYGRLSRRSDEDASGKETRVRTYTYDDGQAPHDESTGMLVAVDENQPTTTLSEEYWYDIDGLIRQTRRCVDDVCVDEGVSYDIAGRVELRHYPDAQGQLGAEDVRFDYDDAGRLAGVGGYATLRYELDDALSSILFGNGVLQEFHYDPRRRSLDGIDLRLPSGDTAMFDYRERDPVGRVLRQRVKGLIDVDLTYHYDVLGRLDTVTSPDPSRNEGFTYDAIGRIDTHSVLGTFAYNDPAHVHAMTATDKGASRTYDDNGNVTHLVDDTRQIALEWTVDDRIAAARTPNGTYEYAYDFSGRRARKQDSNGLTRYFGPRVEIDDQGRITKTYFAGDRVVARRTEKAGVSYPIEDGNRNVRLVTDENGDVTQTNEYTAFGKVTAQGSTSYDRTFSAAPTDNEQDLQLVLMGARTYDPAFGQFLSADSIIPSLARPQSLNRYSYVENDPINFNDPSGHMRMLVELRKLRYEESELLPSYEEAMLANKFTLGFDRGSSLSDFRWEQLVAIATRFRWAVTRHKERPVKSHGAIASRSGEDPDHDDGAAPKSGGHAPVHVIHGGHDEAATAPGARVEVMIVRSATAADTATCSCDEEGEHPTDLLDAAITSGSVVAIVAMLDAIVESARIVNAAKDAIQAVRAGIATAEEIKLAADASASAFKVPQLAGAAFGGIAIGLGGFKVNDWLLTNKYRAPMLLGPIDWLLTPTFNPYRVVDEQTLYSYWRTQKTIEDATFTPPPP